ncbi:MAG: hypothetical protein ATL_03305 [Thaumarchaeota archaeon]|nr:hypothetical protein [Nitrososphaerota archaeon]
MSNINPKYSILILIPLLLIGGYLFLGSNEQTESDMSNDIVIVEPESVPEPVVEPVVEPEPVPEPIPEPVVEPVVEPKPVPEPVVEPVVEPKPDMANPPPASNPSSISILLLDIETNSIIVSVDIEGEFDHWHINLDTQLSESGMAGGVMVTNSYNYKFDDIQPGEHTVYVGAVDSSHSLLGEQVSQTFTIADLVVEEPALDCEFGFAKVEVDMVELCDLIVIREDVFMEINGLFQYKELKIQKGVTITWKTTEDNLGAGGDVNFHQVYELNGLFDSGSLIKGKSWSYTFDEVGVFEYTCPPHPWMMGTIIVVDE